MTSLIEDVKHRIERSALLRLGLLTLLCLCLQIPIAAIEGTISERQMTKQDAVLNVTRTWGDQQTLAGPIMVVPVIDRWFDKDKQVHESSHSAYFLPQTLVVKGALSAEKRYRGIFAVPLYEGTVEVTGDFAPPNLADVTRDERELRWDLATLVVGLSDPRALREQVALRWDDKTQAFEPGKDQAAMLSEGIHVTLPDMGDKGAAHRPHTFAFKLHFGGSGRLAVLPFGNDTRLELNSPWPDPSFDGAYLPTSRTVSAAGFSARWDVPHLGRGYPEHWLDDDVKAPSLNVSGFGVSFYSPVDAYTATTRAVKYDMLFIGLTYLVFFLFEIFQRRRIHPVQYLLVGSALCLFYLLLLALAEHAGFGLAYGIASAAIVVLNGGYCVAILGKRLAALVATGLAFLYGFLFVLLQLEDYALLVGTLGTASLLASLMYATRHVDWYRLAAAPAADTVTA